MASRSPLLSRRYTIVRTAIRLAFLMILVGLPIRYTLDSPLILPITLPPNLGKDVAVPAVDLAVSTLVAPALPVVPFAIMILLPLIFGRGLCGWICPIGLLHEVASLRRKEGKITIYRKAKYLFLAGALLTGLVIAIQKASSGTSELEGVLGPSYSSPMTLFDPSSLIFDFLPLLIRNGLATPIDQLSLGTLLAILQMPTIVWMRITTIAFIVIGASMTPWFWCKYACPSGAAQALVSRFSFVHLRRELHKCVDCRKCQRECPMNIPILKEDWRDISNPECTLCMRCVEVCEKGALRLSV